MDIVHMVNCQCCISGPNNTSHKPHSLLVNTNYNWLLFKWFYEDSVLSELPRVKKTNNSFYSSSLKLKCSSDKSCNKSDMIYFTVEERLSPQELSGTATTTKQSFTGSAEFNITSCPITYYGQKYDKIHVGFNASRFTVCFNGAYKSGIKKDCILISAGEADRGTLDIIQMSLQPGSWIHNDLPNVKHALKCIIKMTLSDSQQTEINIIELGNFEPEASLAITTFSGYTASHVVSVVYKKNMIVPDPSICSTVSCDASAVAAVSVCGPKEPCNGNGSCIPNNVCTVVGSTVIGFAGQVQAVPDRCGYTLFKSTPIPGFQVVGVFQERRRKDVSFLKRVILQLAGAQISLEQGSRALLDTRELRLNTTATVVHGWELTRDQTGVTAKMSASNFTVSVHFDGSITHIHLTGPNGRDAHGLCGNSSRTLSEEKDSTHSVSGCDTQYNEAADPTINCNTSTDWCNLLKQAPFTSCNMQHDPEPFITACTQTLCKYPEGDGFKCQFLEAYARACSLSNVTVEEWKSKTQCSSFYQGFCQDTYCSEHEFCGQKHNGATGCVCRAMFASKYKPTGAFGEPSVCELNAGKVTMAKCLMEDKGIDFSVLHLNDEACKGELDNQTHMVRFSFDKNKTCGTVIEATNSQILYKNNIVNRNSTLHGIIDRQKSISQPISISGRWICNLTMTAYSNPNTKEALQPRNEMRLGQKLWVELNADELDDKIVALVTEACWATDQPSPNGSLRYDLIIKGCPNPADSTVNVKNNGQGTSNRFSFNTFQFSGKGGEVYLHCKVTLCAKKGNNCIQSCGPGARRRRSIMSKYGDENPALIKLAWTF
ncbi:alpha-tectorin-like [Limanda limanda]|uniref:alpha-tectorin-like n=1 Tax=Limanda limanda TaxID=27771 RepID=UPI0029C89127|nr:alpha-tectorin-like [Limanda limanda]